MLTIIYIDFMQKSLFKSIPNSNFHQYQNKKIKPNTKPYILGWIIFSQKLSPEASSDSF